MSFIERRKYERRPFDKSISFYLFTSNTDKVKFNMVDCEGISVDVSKEGLGIVTNHPISTGDTLFFKEDLKINKIIARSAIIRWVREFENNKYRAGLQFIFVHV
jgi:hypothetical protein